MGKPLAADSPSLDRLKALKSLSSFDLQVREAQQLCTHSARADMILKWLLEKTKDSNDAIRTVQTWDILQSSLRLLPHDRIAILLGPSNILAVVERALADEKVSGEVFQSIAASLRLLLELSDSTKGVSIKAVLSLDGAAAATFVQVWMRQCYYQAEDTSQNSSIAVQIWKLRSAHIDEHKLFSEKCLLWTTAVLAKSSVQTSLKRKRNNNNFAIDQDLQALIARHIVLPARAYYLDVQDQKPTKQSQSDQKQQSGLRQLLAPYKSVDESLLGTKSFETTWYNGLPILLDLALRCVPVPTLRHRLKEKPWVEFVFSCIADCIGLDDTSKTQTEKAYTTLFDMLSVIEKRTTLSTETLRKVLRASIFDKHASQNGTRHVVSSEGTGMTLREAVVNRVLCKIIELDASVFLERALLEDLCAYLRSSHDVETNHQDTDEEVLNSASENERLRTPQAVQRLVLAPIMRAFSRERKVTEFVDVWYTQLQECAELEILSAWEGLGDAFAASMETILTEQQIVALLDGFVVKVETSHGSGDVLVETHLTAAVSILGSIIRGVQSESLLNAVHETVGILLKNLLRLLESVGKEIHLPKVEHSQIWTLCTSAFELWYPKMANAEDKTTEFGSSAGQFFSVDLVHRALEVSYELETTSTSRSRAFKAAQQATTLLICLGYHLGGFETSKPAVQALVKQIVKRTRQDLVALPGILRYPPTIMLMSEQQRRSFLDGVLNRFGGVANDTTLSAVIRALCGMTAALPITAARLLVDDIIAAVSRRMSVADGDVHYNQMIAVLNALPTHVLAKSQSGTIIDALTEHHDSVVNNDPSKLVSRLSLIVRLLADRSPAASICTSAASFWSLAEQAGGSVQSSNTHTGEVYVFSSRLACLVTKQLLENQTREESRKVLQDVIAGMKRTISNARTKLKTKRSATSMDLISTLGLSDGIFQAFGDRTSREIKDLVFQSALFEEYIDLVSSSLTSFKKPAEVDYSNFWTTHLVESLISLQISLRTMSLKAQAEQIHQALHRNLTELPLIAKLGLHAGSTQGATELADEALHALVREVQPQQATQVVARFRELCITQLTSGQRAAVVQHLLSAAKLETTALALTLVDAMLSTIGKNDEDDEDTPGKQDILQTALHIALNSSDVTSQQATLRLIITILREKPFLTNQSTVESTLACLQALAHRQSLEGVVFLELCSILTLLLQQYRSRISDRMHLVIGLLQALFSSLFSSTNSIHVSTTGAFKPPASRHAHALARTLQLICDPPPARPNSKSVTNISLVDSSRRAQAQVGQYIPYVLHHYCTQVLSGSAAPGVRDALKPGLWAMIEAMEISDESAVRTLSGAMNVSERAVLRGLYEEWKTTGKWSGN